MIDAQNVTWQLQSQMFDRLAKFEQQAAELSELREKEDWNVTAAKYAPYRTVDGVVVYRLKETRTQIDHMSEFCAFCFGNKKIRLAAK